MFQRVDFEQVRTLAKYALKSEWRSSMANFNRSKKKKPWWVFVQLFLYLLLGAMFIRFFNFPIPSAPYLTSASFVSFYLFLITASNIFLSFGSGFLSPDETQILSPFPITSETFYFSRLVVLLVYSTIIAGSIALVSAILVAIKAGSILAGLSLYVMAILSSTTSAMLIIVLYGLVLSNLPRSQLLKMITYAQLLGSFFVSFSFIILPRLYGERLQAFSLERHPLLQYFPPYWFGSLASIGAGMHAEHLYFMGLAAIIMLAALATVAHFVLARTYKQSLEEFASAAKDETKKASLKERSGRIDPIISLIARGAEGRAAWTVFRAQFRFDTKFRLGLLSTIPMTVIYLVLAIVQGGIHDPFTDKLRYVMSANLLYFIALLSPLMVLQALSQTENFRAAWIFFCTPIDRSKLLLTVRNLLFGFIILPYMIVLVGVFAYFIPFWDAVRHILVIGAISGLIFQGYLLLSPKMPFAQQRRPNRNNYAVVLGIAALAGLALLLLGVSIHFGYRSPGRYWATLSILVTLSVAMEMFVRTRIRVRLDKEEFEG